MRLGQVHIGDARTLAGQLAPQSVHMIVTSPPYYGLRDYGTGKWEGGDPACDHKGPPKRTQAGFNERYFNRPPAESDKQGELREHYRGTCGKCGAVRIDQQMGMEATPDEFVANLVALFAALRPALHDSGTVWLNLGDSYAGGGRGGHSAGINGPPPQGIGNTIPPSVVPDGMKPKDLIGIPWKVAEALKAPQYTGRIKQERDRVWLAAMIDAEGCMFVHKRKVGQNNGQGYERKSDNYAPGLEVSNTSEAIVRRCMEIAGAGSICRVDKDRRQPLYRWNLRTTECRDVVREIYPYLVAKQHQARLLCGCPSSGERAEAAHAGLILLHNGSETTADFPAPASMFEPGWYLRSDIIWHKLNPMPESVRDRPTRSHEYLFLLSKKSTYYYDAEAIREEAQYGRREGTNWSRAREADPRDIRERDVTTTRGADPESGRNKRDVWTIPTAQFAESHFATFPPDLVRPCIRAGTSEKGVCAACGAPWGRVVEREPTDMAARYERGEPTRHGAAGAAQSKASNVGAFSGAVVSTDWSPSCTCGTTATRPAVVLDCFAGSGTVAQVCVEEGREWLAFDLDERSIGWHANRLRALPVRSLFAATGM